MNPPYNGDLHLKILKKVLEQKDVETVNLSPNFYEDYKHIANDTPVASDIEVIDRETSSKIFNGIQLPFNLAIQHYGKNKDYSLLTKYVPETYKIFSSKKFGKSFKDVFVENYDEKGVFIPLKLMTSCWDKNKDYIVDKLGVLIDGKTLDGVYFKDKRNKNKDRSCGGIRFDTVEKAQQFIEWTQTDMFIAWVQAFHTNTRYILSEYPYIDDFTPLEKYFSLTAKEIKTIKKELRK